VARTALVSDTALLKTFARMQIFHPLRSSLAEDVLPKRCGALHSKGPNKSLDLGHGRS